MSHQLKILTEIGRFRSIMLLGCTIFPAWHLIYQYTADPIFQSMPLRIAVGLLFLSFFGLSYIPKFTIDHASKLLLTAAYTLIAASIVFTHMNEYSILYLVGHLVALQACCIVMETKKQFVWYVVSSLLLTGVFGYLGKGDMSSKLVFLVGVANLFIVQFYSVVKKWEAIDIANTQLLENIEQQHKMAALGEATAGVGHEIRNNLATISGSIETVMELVKKQRSQEDIKKFVDMSLRGLSRVANLVMGLQSFSRNTVNETPEKVQIFPICKEAREICTAKAKQYNVVVRIDVPHELSIACLPGQLLQAVVNLVSNAIDATKDLPDRWVKIQAKVTDKKIELKIIDSGLGIPKEIQEKLLEPFYTTKPKGLGTGLGLSISNQLLRNQGADLAIGKESSNTCFTITFPIEAGDSSEVAQHSKHLSQAS